MNRLARSMKDERLEKRDRLANRSKVPGLDPRHSGRHPIKSIPVGLDLPVAAGFSLTTDPGPVGQFPRGHPLSQ